MILAIDIFNAHHRNFHSYKSVWCIRLNGCHIIGYRLTALLCSCIYFKVVFGVIFPLFCLSLVYPHDPRMSGVV